MRNTKDRKTLRLKQTMQGIHVKTCQKTLSDNFILLPCVNIISTSLLEHLRCFVFAVTNSDHSYGRIREFTRCVYWFLLKPRLCIPCYCYLLLLDYKQLYEVRKLLLWNCSLWLKFTRHRVWGCANLKCIFEIYISIPVWQWMTLRLDF